MRFIRNLFVGLAAVAALVVTMLTSASAQSPFYAVTYLDVIARVRALTGAPLAAYHVSGEYAMIKAAAANGWIDGWGVAVEQLTAVKRAGADMILTYFARELAEAFHG